MTEAQIRDHLLELMQRELDWTGPLPDTLSDHFTSLQLITFAEAVEDRFGIELTPEATLGLDAVDDLVAAVAAALP
jgi:acyl carrier protein